jgi:hypothetical protein
MRLVGLLWLVLALAGSAGGAPRPTELLVWPLLTKPGAPAETVVEVTNPPSSLSIALPAGYGVLASPPGTVVGVSTIRFAGGRRTSATLVAAPGGWLAGGLTIAFDSHRLSCTLPPGTADVEIDLRRALTNPATPGIYVWRTGGATSAVALPQALILRARFTGGQLVVTGRLVAAERPRAGVKVHVDVSPGPDFATFAESIVTTRLDGSFTLRQRRGTGIAYVVASVSFYAAGAETIAPPPSAYVVAGA